MLAPILSTSHSLTAGEVVLTTYMGVVLFLERPALPSAPRPQTSPSSCAALQLRKGNLYSGEQARRSHTMLTRSTLPGLDSCALQFTFDYNITRPTTSAAVNQSISCWHPLARPNSLSMHWRRQGHGSQGIDLPPTWRQLIRRFLKSL